MKSVQIKDIGTTSSLEIGESPDPVAGPREVLVSVRAAGVNRADLMQRAGKYPAPQGSSEILGLEVSGVIEGVGVGVAEWKEGDEVCALLTGGGYAEKVSVPVGQLLRKPSNVSLSHAAAIPEAFLTAYANLCVEGALAPGEKVLIHGGSSGVGTAAIQIAKRCGAEVVCTVGDDAKGERCRQLGAAEAFNYKAAPFDQQVSKWSPAGVNLILDIVGRDYFAQNISVLSPQGRLVCIATMSGAKVELDVRTLMQKRLRIIGSVLRSRTVEEKSMLVAEFSTRFMPMFEDGGLKPVVHEVFSFCDVEKAHALMRSSAHTGKILLEWR